MQATLGTAKQAVSEFLKDSNAKDEFFLATVSSNPELHSGLTHDADALLSSIQFASAYGDTALIDTVYLALNRIRLAQNALRALLVISDEMDNHSRYSKNELMRAALEADTQIYTIALDRSSPNQKPIQKAEASLGLLLMSDLAEKMGGLNFVIRNASDVVQAAAKAGVAIRNQYVIGFSATP